MKFQILKYADISTGYLTTKDLDLISDNQCPFRMAEHDCWYGTFFNMPADDDLFEEGVQEAREFGLSEHFIQIVTELKKQGEVALFIFDADGGEITGGDGKVLPFVGEIA